MDINCVSESGKTALINAVLVNNIEIAEYLLKTGADKNIKDNKDMTAYDYAIEYEHGELAELLKP